LSYLEPGGDQLVEVFGAATKHDTVDVYAAIFEVDDEV
jgi:hypothetical protein